MQVNIPKVFQPTPPRGGRPSKGVIFASYYYFNPRPRVGGDANRSNSKSTADRFQPTPPRGGRPTPTLQNMAYQKFQPTPPRGGRLPLFGDY